MLNPFKRNHEQPHGGEQLVGFAMEPEELLERLNIDPNEFETLAYTPPELRGVPTVIGGDEFERARRDPRVHAFLDSAKAYYERCQEQDRRRLEGQDPPPLA